MSDELSEKGLEKIGLDYMTSLWPGNHKDAPHVPGHMPCAPKKATVWTFDAETYRAIGRDIEELARRRAAEKWMVENGNALHAPNTCTEEWEATESWSPSGVRSGSGATLTEAIENLKAKVEGGGA